MRPQIWKNIVLIFLSLLVSINTFFAQAPVFNNPTLKSGTDKTIGASISIQM
jgi:hypothetical protein